MQVVCVHASQTCVALQIGLVAPLQSVGARHSTHSPVAMKHTCVGADGQSVFVRQPLHMRIDASQTGVIPTHAVGQPTCISMAASPAPPVARSAPPSVPMLPPDESDTPPAPPLPEAVPPPDPPRVPPLPPGDMTGSQLYVIKLHVFPCGQLAFVALHTAGLSRVGRQPAVDTTHQPRMAALPTLPSRRGRPRPAPCRSRPISRVIAQQYTAAGNGSPTKSRGSTAWFLTAWFDQSCAVAVDAARAR
jgi:hypothetical protein